MKNEFIIVDKQTAKNFIHNMNHIDYSFVPDEILDLKFKLTTGKETSFRELVKITRSQVEKLGGYIKLSVENSES